MKKLGNHKIYGENSKTPKKKSIKVPITSKYLFDKSKGSPPDTKVRPYH